MTFGVAIPPTGTMTGLRPPPPTPAPSQAWQDQGQRWLPSIWKDKPKLWAVLSGLLDQVQQLEDAHGQLITKTQLDTAEGQALDVLGGLLGWPREGRGDTSYRRELHTRARMRAGGTSYVALARTLACLMGSQAVASVRADVWVGVWPRPPLHSPTRPQPRPDVTPFLSTVIVSVPPVSYREGGRFARLLSGACPAGAWLRLEYEPLGYQIQSFDALGVMPLIEADEPWVLPEAAGVLS